MTRANIKLQGPPVSIRKHGSASKQIKRRFQNKRHLGRCMQQTQWCTTLLSHSHFCSHCSQELIAELTTGHSSPNVLSKTYLWSLPLYCWSLNTGPVDLDYTPGRFVIQPFLVENYNFPWRVILIQTLPWKRAMTADRRRGRRQNFSISVELLVLDNGWLFVEIIYHMTLITIVITVSLRLLFQDLFWIISITENKLWRTVCSSFV